MSTTESEEAKRELWEFIYFDFENYTTQDWMIFGGSILLIITLNAVCCYCVNKLRLRNIPDSTINIKTGRTRVSLFEIVTHKQSQDRQKSLGFDAYKQASLSVETVQTQSNDGTKPETEMQPVHILSYS